MVKSLLQRKLFIMPLIALKGSLSAPVEVFHEALDNIKPTVEVRSEE